MDFGFFKCQIIIPQASYTESALVLFCQLLRAARLGPWAWNAPGIHHPRDIWSCESLLHEKNSFDELDWGGDVEGNSKDIDQSREGSKDCGNCESCGNTQCGLGLGLGENNLRRLFNRLGKPSGWRGSKRWFVIDAIIDDMAYRNVDSELSSIAQNVSLTCKAGYALFPEGIFFSLPPPWAFFSHLYLHLGKPLMFLFYSVIYKC